ncbi:MAG: NAD-dependent succinate-semialdehyde dehydrogenase [Bacteroidetes bacterium]|nr:NAD-dependent succinate-semialdehyde dehydrogenase [Bacteroidota bacterium]MBS1540299.1 NAD-dependent succinate-semialdehyde dehydrogenase [Bacteroidota bacterium]
MFQLSDLQLPLTPKQYINGQWCDATNGKTWKVINPATEKTIVEVPFGNGKDGAAAIAAATAAFRSWSATNPYERAVILKKASALMHERLSEYAKVTVLESGKPLTEAVGEWRVAANFFEWYAEEGKRNYGSVIPANRNNKRMSVLHQPMGVIGAITAWNFPAYNPARCWSAALGAGCTVVAKVSEYTPLTGILLAQCLHDAGLPPGVLNVVNGEPASIGEEMLNNPAVRKISFTGSTRVGKILMDGASKNIKRLALELGGNAPVIIFPDVDVKKVAEESVVAKLRNAGQVCIAPQRYIVHESIVKEFTERAAAKMQQIKIGHGLESTTDMGPMINAAQRDNLEKLVQASQAAGANVIVGGQRGKNEGYFYQPTLVRPTDANNPVFQQEIFGPVMPVLSFGKEEEAIQLANATQYGLASYLWTNDLKTSIRVSEQIEFGMVGINEWYPQAFEAPFGGWKQSGLGYECGQDGLEEYQEKKLISIGGL